MFELCLGVRAFLFTGVYGECTDLLNRVLELSFIAVNSNFYFHLLTI